MENSFCLSSALRPVLSVTVNHKQAAWCIISNETPHKKNTFLTLCKFTAQEIKCEWNVGDSWM